MVIYLDLFFAVNLVMDLLILLATGLYLGRGISIPRVGLAALAGAMYALGYVLLPASILFSPAGKVLFGLAMVAVAFPTAGFKGFLRAAAVFYALSFLVAGTYFATSFLLLPPAASEGVFFVRGLSFGLLSLTMALLLALGKPALEFIRSKLRRDLGYLDTEVVTSSGRARFRSLVDTGNELRDPVTGMPVIIVEYRALREALRDELEVLGSPPLDALEILASGKDPELARRVKVMTYSSVGNENGMLLGFRPQELVVRGEGLDRVFRDIVVAVYPRPLSRDGVYRALLPASILREKVS